MNIFASRKAQNLTEVALLMGVVALVFIGMEVYFRRGFQNKMKTMTDNYMTSNVFGGGNLYDSEGRNLPLPHGFVGYKQEAYEVDTHNYVVQESNTPTQSNSSVHATTLTGGGRVENTQQDIVVGPSTSRSVVNY